MISSHSQVISYEVEDFSTCTFPLLRLLLRLLHTHLVHDHCILLDSRALHLLHQLAGYKYHVHQVVRLDNDGVKVNDGGMNRDEVKVSGKRRVNVDDGIEGSGSGNEMVFGDAGRGQQLVGILGEEQGVGVRISIKAGRVSSKNERYDASSWEIL